MYCEKCGCKLVEGAKFCPECGNDVEQNTFDGFGINDNETVDSFSEPAEVHVPRCFTVFANVGYILALVGFICSFIPIVCSFTYQASIVGLVFCILGKRDPQLVAKTKKGRIFGILGIVFGFFMIIISSAILEMII